MKAIKCLFGAFVPLLIFASCSSGLTIRLNEQLVVERLKAIRSAQESYRSARGDGKYGTMSDLIANGYIKRGTENGNSKGYIFTIKISENGYKAIAIPVKYGESGTGIYSYYLDQSGVIRGSNKKGGEASENDLPVGEKSD